MRRSRVWFLWFLQRRRSLHIISAIQTAAGMIQLKGMSLEVVWQAIYEKIKHQNPRKYCYLHIRSFKRHFYYIHFIQCIHYSEFSKENNESIQFKVKHSWKDGNAAIATGDTLQPITSIFLLKTFILHAFLFLQKEKRKCNLHHSIQV